VTAPVRHGPLLLRGAALLLALGLHAVAALALFWPREPKPPLTVPAVAVTLSGAAGMAEEGAGAPPAEAAPPLPPSMAPAPEPVMPVAPEAAAEPGSPAHSSAPAEPAVADLPLPPPTAPAPPQPVVARPPASPPRPPAAPGPMRLDAGMAMNTAPGPETRAARPRDLACSDAMEYPEELRQAGIGGDVVLRLRLTDKGRVIEAKVAESSGHPQLDDSAHRSLRRCRFEPALRDGLPVWSNLTWRVTYRP
jgi:protein TonB